VRQKKRQYLAKDRGKMSIWEALDYLNTLVDESDPDTIFRKSNTTCKLPRPFARTVIRAGSC